VAPLDVDAVRTVQVGTALWAAALVVAVVQRHRLVDDGHQWWLWTCVAGLVLGLIGIVITTRRRARLARREHRPSPGDSSGQSS
jgi:O-antigen/teichoic acid export membrane protein